MILTLTMLATVVAVAFALAMLPTTQTQGTPLGVRVPRAQLADAAVRTAIARYRQLTLLAGLTAALVVLAGAKFPLLAGLSSLVVVVGAMWAWVSQRRRIMEAKVAGGWFDEVETAITGAISADARTAEFPTPRTPWIWIGAAALAIAVSALVVAQHWDAIPTVVATHWGPSLQADAWADKSIGSVFSLSFVNLFMLVLMWAITATVTWGHVRGRNDQTTRGRLRTAATLAATNQGLGALMFGIIFSLALLQIVAVVPGLEGWMTAVFVFTMVVCIGGLFPLLILVLRAQTQVDDMLRGVTLPDDDKESPDNDRFYKWGMFYYNPDDPAVLVEKRAGVGMDFNYATWQGKAFLACMLAVIIGCVALPFIL